MAYLDRIALSVRHAAHPERTRYAMNGVLVEQKGIVATDGKILAHVTHAATPSGQVPDAVLTLDTVKATLKAMLSTGHAVLNGELTACIPGAPAVEAKGRRKAKAAVPDKVTKITLETVPGVFPPWEDVTKADDHLPPIETNIDTLETIGNVLGGHAVARLTYDDDGIIASAEARPIDENGNRVGDYTASVRFDCFAAGGDEHLAAFNPSYFATIAKIVREFHKGEDWAGAITLTLPNGRKPKRNGNGPEAKAALFVHAKRTDGRKLTVLLMPIRLGA